MSDTATVGAPMRVVVADDQTLVRIGFRLIRLKAKRYPQPLVHIIPINQPSLPSLRFPNKGHALLSRERCLFEASDRYQVL